MAPPESGVKLVHEEPKDTLPVPGVTVSVRCDPSDPIELVVYSRTFEDSEPVYVTVMHDWAESPGFAFVTLYRAELESLSDATTVPAANRLPSFEVELENAENVPRPAITPTIPITMTVSKSLRVPFLTLGAPSFPSRHRGSEI